MTTSRDLVITQAEDLLRRQRGHGWMASCLAFLGNHFGKTSEYYVRFQSLVKQREKELETVDLRSPASRALRGMAEVIEAAKQDAEAGYLIHRDMLITADAFENFLEQAEYLLSQNYKDAAAVLVGGVLEATLRKMCGLRDIEIGAREKIGTLNDKLAKHADPPAYSSMDHKQIIVWAELRDNAAHAHYDKYSDQDAADMLKWVRDCAARHLG